MIGIYLPWPEAESIYIHRPVQVERTDTQTYQGIFSLLELIKHVMKHGAEVYRR